MSEEEARSGIPADGRAGPHAHPRPLRQGALQARRALQGAGAAGGRPVARAARRTRALRCDERFALRVPIDVIARLLGVDESRLEEFREWSEGAILGLNPFAPKTTPSASSSAPMRSRIYGRADEAPPRRAQGRPRQRHDAAPGGGRAARRRRDLQQSPGLLIGGNLTTTDLIGNAVWLFLTHPQELAKLKADPTLINNAVEEVLRYESPVDITGRIAPRDMEIGGCPVKQTQSIFTSLRGANRDPGAFPRSAPLRHRAQGRAACRVRRRPASVHRRALGAARGAGRARHPVRALPQAAPRGPDARPQWRAMPFFRGLKELAVLA